MQVDEHPVEQEEVMAYLDGELPPEQSAVVAAHLDECGDCRALAAELRDLSRHLANWRIEAPIVRLPWKPKRMAIWKLVGAAAAACLLIALLATPRIGHQASREMYRPAPAPAARPMIARISQLVLITKEFDQVRGAVEDILKRHRGYLGQLGVTAPADGPRVFTATLRIPADQLDSTIAEMKKLGPVESESQSGEEVTGQYVDLEARLTNARNTEQRLTALLHDRAGQMTDVLAVEKEVDRVRGEIEQMDAEKKALVNRVDFATLNVTVKEASKAQLSPHLTLDRVRNAAADGYASLLVGVVAALVFLLSHGPSLLFWGALSFLVLRLALKSWRKLKFGR